MATLEKAYTRYSPEQIERGLLVLALNAGRPCEASDQLKSEGIDIAESTLRYWRDTSHAERYAQLASDQQDRVRQVVAAKYEQVAARATDLELKFLDQIDRDLANGDLPARDRPSAFRNIATAKGINQDKASAARGQATTIVQHNTTPQELFRGLKAIGIDVIDGTAEEVEEGQESLASSRSLAPQRAPE